MSHERTVQPVVDRDLSHEHGHKSSQCSAKTQTQSQPHPDTRQLKSMWDPSAPDNGAPMDSSCRRSARVQRVMQSSGENGSLNDLEYDDVTISISLSSPLFTQEREDDASRRRACHSQDEGLSSSLSSSASHRTVRPRCLLTCHERPRNSETQL